MAVSLCVNVRVVHGTCDCVSPLDCAEVNRISTAEVCDGIDFGDVEAPVLKSLSYYNAWKKKMTAHY